MKVKLLGRTWRFAGTAAVVGLIALVLGVGIVLAVNESDFFELGPGTAGGVTDIADDPSLPGPDWGSLFNADGTPTLTMGPGGIAKAFLKDELSQKGPKDSTTFAGAGGSNKNNDPVGAADCVAQGLPPNCDSWHWDGGNVPAKDDLSNVYAYAIIEQEPSPDAGHLVIYTGFERLAPEGDSHIDIEFFQDTVSLDEDAPCDDAGNDTTPCGFTGVRTVNDLIVSMDFLNGGALEEVTIHRWDGTQYVDAGTVQGNAECNDSDTVCAYNNGAPIEGGPWDNYDRGGAVITTLPTNSFTEFGVDVTALFGSTPCFTTYMGKTRSSQSFTAELKDFAGPGSFPICGANITIDPDGVNVIGEPHTFTVTASAATGGIPSPAPDGTIVTVTLTATGGASVSNLVDTCANPGTVGGSCTVTFTSDTVGVITGHAAADITFGGHTFHTETDGVGGNSDDAVKQYIAGSLAWSKVDNASRLLGGATFDACRTHDRFGADIIPDECVSVTDNVAPDADPDAGEFLLTGLKLGSYTVTETAAPPGYEKDPNPKTAELTLAQKDATIAIAFVNQRPILKLSEFGYTNAPTGTPTDGVVSGTTTYTVKIKNFGGAGATSYSGTLNVTENSTGGSLSCPGAPKAISGGPLAPNVEAVYTLTCTYTNLDDGSAVTASLSAVQYTLNGLSRTASGTPATISFTVQGD